MQNEAPSVHDEDLAALTASSMASPRALDALRALADLGYWPYETHGRWYISLGHTLDKLISEPLSAPSHYGYVGHERTDGRMRVSLMEWEELVREQALPLPGTPIYAALVGSEVAYG